MERLLEQQILEEECIPYQKRGGTILLTTDKAADLVGAAQKRGLLVIGIDVFDLRDGVTPLMDWIADYSALIGTPDSAPRSWECARAFLKKLRDEGPLSCGVEVTLQDE